MMRHPVSKMKGLSLSVVLLAHSANAPTTRILKMKKITIYKSPYQSLWRFVAIFVFLPSPLTPDLSLLLLQLLGDA